MLPTEVVPVILFDELHKYPRWKQFLKGFFDTYADQTRITVTGSSRFQGVARDGKPWFLCEVKYQDDSISPALGFYQKQLKAPFAFQLVIDADYVDADCFARPGGPVVVPAKTLLSQLL